MSNQSEIQMEQEFKALKQDFTRLKAQFENLLLSDRNSKLLLNKSDVISILGYKKSQLSYRMIDALLDMGYLTQVGIRISYASAWDCFDKVRDGIVSLKAIRRELERNENQEVTNKSTI